MLPKLEQQTASITRLQRASERFWILGTHFTCFSGTKVQILTQTALLEFLRRQGIGRIYDAAVIRIQVQIKIKNL
jgi:hypothetical protein